MASYNTPNEPSPEVIYNVDCMHEALNESGYICSPEFAAKVVPSINTKPVSGAFLYGMAGTGKSYLPMILAKVLDRQLFIHQCTQGTREEDLLVKIMPSEDTTSGVKIGEGKILQAAIESRERPVILMLDEWDKTRPSADGFFLDFLQYGRLSLPGIKDGNIQANLENLTIFITANDEREFHEALLRRFPMIHVNPLEPVDVVSALKLTHKNNTYIPQMLDLYIRSVAAKLPKPATIQELRQMMDAIDILGSSADWDALVYQYVTKTPENHLMLSRQAKVEGFDIDSIACVNADDYGLDYVPEGKTEDDKLKMPSLRDLAEFDESFEVSSYIPENASVVIARDNDDTKICDDIIMNKNMNSNDPDLASMPDWGVITKDYAYLTDDIHSHDAVMIDTRNDFKKLRGEVKIKDKYITRAELNRMISHKWYISKRDKNEIIARKLNTKNVDLRYIEGKGVEIIANTHGSLEGLFKLNARENLVRISQITFLQEKMSQTEYALSEIDGNCSNNIAVSGLWGVIVEGRYDIGNSVLKSMSEHDGFCNGYWLHSPRGMTYAECKLSQVPSFLELTNDKGKFQVHSNGLGFSIKSKNLTFSAMDFGNYQLGMMKLDIDDVVDAKTLSYINLWIAAIPLYRCFKHDGDIAEKLRKAGWKIHYRNVNTLHRNGIYAHIVYDYVMFCSFIGDNPSMDEPMLSLEIKSKIKRIKALERTYKSAQV